MASPRTLRPGTNHGRNLGQLRGQSLGQFLIVGFEATEMTPRLATMLKRIQPAGVILFARNLTTAQPTWRLLRDCQKCVSTPLFTCVDLEGGRVDRFRDVLGPTPPAAEVFATQDRKLFRKHGQLIGANCRALGFNVDFAPVLDLAFEASRSVLSSRAVSANPREVILYAREFLAGLRALRVLGCGKHFPGLGEGTLDSHLERPIIDKPLKTLWTEDLLPYRSLRAQLPMAMISHAAYPQVTRDRTPASLSKKWITDILRRRIGFRNLIVSDDLEMGAVLTAASVGESAVEHIRAGGDLCLVCHSEEYIEQACERLASAARQDAVFARRASESAGRILAFKKKSAEILTGSKAPSEASLAQLSRKLWEFEEQVRVNVNHLSRGQVGPGAGQRRNS
jgi:beta-N-acetylhexosaminidase